MWQRMLQCGSGGDISSETFVGDKVFDKPYREVYIVGTRYSGYPTIKYNDTTPTAIVTIGDPYVYESLFKVTNTKAGDSITITGGYGIIIAIE